MIELSVVIPTFDRPELLRETLSLLATQSVAPDEVVVVDNGNAPTELGGGADFPFPLRYFRINARAGVAQARNFGAAVASGRYVAFLDDDDLWDGNYVERLKAIVTAPGRAAPAMVVARIDHLEGTDRHSFRFAGDDTRLEACFYFNPGYLGSAITVERIGFLQLGGFDTAFATGEDKELAIRYMVNGRPIRYEAGLVAVNRVHERSLSREIDYLTTARMLLSKYRKQTDLRIRMRALREAYKKTGKTRYFLHILVLKLALAALRLAPGRRSKSPAASPSSLLG
jgi:glycosyltransferase involved in cell wall biosynthesis